MLKTVLSKTLYEKRWGLLWWSLAMFLFTIMIVASFPIFQETFGQQMDSVPDSLKSIVGEAADYQRVEGFLELQVFMQMVFLTFIYGIILFTALIAGEESSGTLQTQLAQPISRSRLYFEKLLAGAALLGAVSLVLFVAVWFGTALIGEPVNIWKLAQASGVQWLLGMVFGLFAYMVGSVSGRKGLAGALAGMFAFVSYLGSTLVGTVEVLRLPNYFSPFRYYNNTGVLEQGAQLGNVAVLLGACVVFGLIGWVVFIKRDIYQR